MFCFLVAFSLCEVSIVPRPATLTELDGKFWTLAEGMEIGYSTSSKSFSKDLAKFISDSLYTPTGIRLSVSENSAVKLGIQLDSAEDDEYHLSMDENLVTIKAKNRELLFDGFQTLLQILPAQIYAQKLMKDVEWKAQCVTVHDSPRFQWRGLMIDVCRHFFDVDVIKTILDGMSHFKLNVLHFHITEDQGWRLELKKFPNLTEKGSIRDGSPKHGSPGQLDGIPYGPFYFTEEDCQEIIRYAAERSIKILPEIEMPGHALALLSGYPQYSCTGGPFKPRCFWGVEEDIICAGNDEAIKFLEQILDEVLRIFDNVFISCGGDECPRTRWETCPKCQKRIKDEGLANTDQLQSWFTQHFAKYLDSKGRRLVGWDEILNGNLPLPEQSVVMSWRGTSGGERAVKLGHDVVMCPNTQLYLDYWQFPAPEPYEYLGGLTTTYGIFHYNPTAGIEEQYQHHILGIQGNLWSEYIWEKMDLQYKTFPRALAVAVTGWEQHEAKDWVRFMHDYAAHERYALSFMDVIDASLQYGRIAEWFSGDLSQDKYVSVEFNVDECLNQKGTIEAGFVYISGHNTHVRNVKFIFDGSVVAEDDHDGIAGQKPSNSVYTFNTDVKPGKTTTVQAEMMCEGGTDCEGVIYISMVTMKGERIPIKQYEY